MALRVTAATASAMIRLEKDAPIVQGCSCVSSRSDRNIVDVVMPRSPLNESGHSENQYAHVRNALRLGPVEEIRFDRSWRLARRSATNATSHTAREPDRAEVCPRGQNAFANEPLCETANRQSITSLMSDRRR
jgi:hypothetical protein